MARGPSEDRWTRTGDRDSRNQSGKALGESVERGLVASVEEHGHTLRRRGAAQFEGESGSVDTIGKTDMVEKVECPSHGLAVRSDQIKRVEPGAMLGIVMAGHHAMHGEGRDTARFASNCSGHDALDGGLVVDGIDGNAEQVDLARVDHDQRSRFISCISRRIESMVWVSDQFG